MFTAHDVHHPDLIPVETRFVIIGIPTQEHPGIFDPETHVAIWHITELRDLPVPVASSSNGTAN